MSFVEVLTRSLTRPSNWQFVTSEGGDVSVGLVALSTGNIYARDEHQSTTRFMYAFAGAGVSVGLPASIAVSTTSMPSLGRIYLGPGASGDRLDLADFSGGVLAIGTSASPAVLGLGSSSTIIFFGANQAVMSVLFTLSLTPAGPFLSSALWRQFRGIAVLAGQNRGIQGGAGLSVMTGRIFRPV